MVRRCLKVKAGFLASLETPVARDEPGVPGEQRALLPIAFGPFIPMVMVAGKQVANTSFLGK